MRNYSLSYQIGRSFKGFARNGFMTFASILILTSCLLISGCFGLLIYNIYVNLNNLNGLNEIVCICQYDITKEELDAVAGKLNALDGIEEISFTSKDEALKQLETLFEGYPQVFERITAGENPLPDVYTIRYTDSDEAVNLVFTLSDAEKFPEFKSVDDKVEVAKTLESLKNTVLWIFLVFMSILLIISVIIIMNTVSMSISTRSKEITVMRYVGATNSFITFPFYMETLLVGFVSTAISYGLLILAYDYLFNLIATQDTGSSQLITVVPFGSLWLVVLAIFAAVAVLTCIIGTAISLHKHVKV